MSQGFFLTVLPLHAPSGSFYCQYDIFKCFLCIVQSLVSKIKDHVMVTVISHSPPKRFCPGQELNQILAAQ